MNFFSYFSNGCNLKQKNGAFDFPLSYMALSNLLSFSISASDVHDLLPQHNMLLTLNRETKFILSDICFPFIQQNDFSI